MLQLKKLDTEQSNPASIHIDKMDTLAILKLMNDEDKKIAPAIEKILPQIAKAVDLITAKLKKGGRLFYLGAGTSGRLGILDAVECPPTFSTPPEMVQGIIAGGTPAIFKAQEGAEDSPSQAGLDLQAKNFSSHDILVGIAASGRTPYVIGAIEYARQTGASSIAVACSPAAEISQLADIALTILPGPEVITGSTRLKAGTAQKMVLNMLSTATMIHLGKVYGNLMIDVKPSNKKLKERAKNIVCTATGCTNAESISALTQAKGCTKLAVFLVLSQLPLQEAKKILASADGYVAKALSLVKGV